MLDANYLQSREFLSLAKEKLLRLIYSVINQGNSNNEPDKSKVISPFHQYRFHVGRGNNHVLVRQVIKQRWWWSIYEEEDLVHNNNFLWTQWRKNKHLAFLGTKFPVTNK
jgi:hypothetical protein